MSGILLELLFENPGEGRDSEREVLLYGEKKEASEQQSAAISAYQASSKYKEYKQILRGKIGLNGMIDSSLTVVDFTWSVLEERIYLQRQTRPRGQGCIFRFYSPENEPLEDGEDQQKEEQEYLRYEIDREAESHPGESYIFLGALWDRDSRVRIGSPILIEAPSMKSASRITDLWFGRRANQTALTDWCPPIYEAKFIT